MFNTAREADRHKPGGEEPESVVCVDAAAECNWLMEEIEKLEATKNTMRNLLENILDSGLACHLYDSVVKVLADNPRSPADSSDRDGQRSYGV